MAHENKGSGWTPFHVAAIVGAVGYYGLQKGYYELQRLWAGDHRAATLKGTQIARVKAKGEVADRLKRAAFSPDGSRICACTREGDLCLWEVSASGPPLVLERGLYPGDDNVQPAWSPDGSRIAVLGDARETYIFEFTVYCALTGSRMWRLPERPRRLPDVSEVRDYTCSPEGRQIACREWAALVIRDGETGKEMARPIRWTATRWVQKRMPGGGIEGREITDPQRVVRCEWSPDGRWMYLTREAGARELWRTDRWEKVCTLSYDHNGEEDVIWSPNSRCVARGGSWSHPALDSLLFPGEALATIYDAEIGRTTHVFHYGGWTVGDIAWSPDSRLILFDWHVRDTASGRLLYELDFPEGPVLPYPGGTCWTASGQSLRRLYYEGDIWEWSIPLVAT